MAAALRNLLGQGARQRLVLIGYSGGGTLAMLLAERLGPVAVVTIGANLDVDAWARYHDYTPLRGSLDPGRRPPLSAEIFQLHLAGGKDTNVPPDLISPVVTRHPHAEFLVIRDYDHRCCWEKIWSSILARIDGSSS
jgi:pimeloyl-ACP methyl ester carboxylesterase